MKTQEALNAPMASAGLPPQQAPADGWTIPAGSVLSRAESADCTCPEYCDRDHGNE